MKPELKLCPFCGETPTLEADLIEYQPNSGVNVLYLVHHCFNGLEVATESRSWHADAAPGFNSRDGALVQVVEDWNTRADDNRRCENCKHCYVSSGYDDRKIYECPKLPQGDDASSSPEVEPEFFCAYFTKRED